MTPETGARNTGARECAFCLHHYVNPCDEKRKLTCQNWLHLQTTPAAPTKPKVERVKLNPQPKAKKKAKRK